MEDVFFGDVCPRSREIDGSYVESRIMSKGNRATSSSSPPNRECMQLPPDGGNIYHACTENSYPTD